MFLSHDISQFFAGKAKRLFTKHALAGAQRLDRLPGMEVVPRGDHYGVNRRILPNLVLGSGAELKAKFLGGMFAADSGGIAHSDQANAFSTLHCGDQCRSSKTARTDHADL